MHIAVFLFVVFLRRLIHLPCFIRSQLPKHQVFTVLVIFENRAVFGHEAPRVFRVGLVLSARVVVHLPALVVAPVSSLPLVPAQLILADSCLIDRFTLGFAVILGGGWTRDEILVVFVAVRDCFVGRNVRPL